MEIGKAVAGIKQKKAAGARAGGRDFGIRGLNCVRPVARVEFQSPNYRIASIALARSSLGRRPTKAFTFWPPLKIMTVGIPRMPNLAARS
jgi:hypothetical protein